MNAIGLLFTNMIDQKVVPTNTNKQQSEQNGMFQQLLASMHGSEGKESANLAQAFLEELDGLFANSFLDGISLEELNQVIEQMLSNQIDGLTNLLAMHNETNIDPMTEEAMIENLGLLQGYILQQANNQSSTIEDQTKIQEQLQAIFGTFQSILQTDLTEENVKKLAPKILDLLQQWSKLQGNAFFDKNATRQANQEGLREQNVWRDLVQAFQKRNQFAANQQYNGNSKVTTTDIAKGLTHSLNQHNQTEPMINHSSLNLGSMPMSKIEQYVIHVNQSQNTVSVDQQLIEQFQKVMNSSKLSTLPNGVNQLSISLRPDNLGEMMVRLTQINGEMTVKILVSSQAAKEMLESNMNQLRNMFSPNQVVIERQEVNTQQQGQSMQKNDEDQSLKDHRDQQSGHSQSENDQETNDEIDFESTFQELMLNEKV